MTIFFELVGTTKTCAVYRAGDKKRRDFQTIYLKLSQLAEAGIDPDKAILVTIKGVSSDE
jgi:hypothetical protein